jgi:Neuraminidase (sialidase)
LTFAITNFTLGGTTFKYANGSIIHDYVPGNVKQWSGGEWNNIDIPNKDKIRQIRIEGNLISDENKVLLEGFRDSGTYSYTDGILTLTKVVVMDLQFDFRTGPSSGQSFWHYVLVVEEYNQA